MKQKIKELCLKISWLVIRSWGIKSYIRSHSVRKLQLGAGQNIMEGWLSTDLSPRQKGALYLDVRKRFPFENETFNYILAEHLIEHLTYKGGLSLLRECLRVLKPGGKIRVATPDLDIVLGLRTYKKTDLQQRYIKWHIDNCLPEIGIYKDIFVINNAFNGFGHHFIYDQEILQSSLKEAGFVDIIRHASGESNDENLRGVELRAKDEMLKFTGLVLEATHPE
jgi:predicted SAM-dependent methyltransferase